MNITRIIGISLNYEKLHYAFNLVARASTMTFEVFRRLLQCVNYS